MAVIALNDAFVYIAGHDFTGDSNQMNLTHDAAALDATTFASGGWSEVAGGLKTQAFELSGHWQSATSGSVDSEAFPDLAVADRVFSVGPLETETSPSFMFQAGKFAYQIGGSIGELAPFSLTSAGTNGVGVVRGALAKAKGTVTATGATGSVVELGAVGASQYLYAALHVFSRGTTITVQVQSDDNSGFTSPTTRGTIGPITATGGTWMTRVAGPITDTFWRFNVSAITGTHSIAGSIGIK